MFWQRREGGQGPYAPRFLGPGRIREEGRGRESREGGHRWIASMHKQKGKPPRMAGNDGAGKS